VCVLYSKKYIANHILKVCGGRTHPRLPALYLPLARTIQIVNVLQEFATCEEPDPKNMFFFRIQKVPSICLTYSLPETDLLHITPSGKPQRL